MIGRGGGAQTLEREVSRSGSANETLESKQAAVNQEQTQRGRRSVLRLSLVSAHDLVDGHGNRTVNVVWVIRPDPHGETRLSTG